MKHSVKACCAVVVACLFGIPLIFGSALAADTWKLGHVGVGEADNPYHATALKFKELVEKGSEGEIKVQVFPQGQLGDDRALLEGVQGGMLDASASTLGPISAFVPVIDIMELPFLFRDIDHLDAVLEGKVGREILDTLEKSGFKGLGFFEDGINNITNSKHPIKTLEDFKGLQMRTIESPIRVAIQKALGANPVPVAYAELYTALQTGVVDGQSNPNWVITANSLWEVQKYVTITQHIWGGAVLLLNKDKFERLSPEDQKMVLEAGIKACRYGREQGREAEKAHLRKAVEKGMIVEENPDLASMRKATQTIFADISADSPERAAFIEKIEKAGMTP